MPRILRGLRWRYPGDDAFIAEIEALPYLEFSQTLRWYAEFQSRTENERAKIEADIGTQLDKEVAKHGRDIHRRQHALLGCNDRYYLLTGLLARKDALHPWLFDRCREVENDPDGYIDLWARFHYKSTLITFAGLIQEVLCNPDIKIAIFSAVKPIAQAFLQQIKEEFENNETLKQVYPEVLYENPRGKDSDGKRPAKWSVARGITVKRSSNPKEATIEAHGLLDGQPTSRHFDLLDFDDVVTQDYLSEDQIRKTTERWEMADNLGSHEGVRKWMPGTRYHFADTNGIIIERKSLKPRIYPATDDGTLNGKPVFLSAARWEQLKRDQRSTVSAQLLLNPTAGDEATFNSQTLRPYEIIPRILNVYILVDPSKGSSERSDRTAIAVIGIDPAANKYLLDGVRHRMRLSERWTYVKQFKAYWENFPGVQLVKVGWERYGMQVDLEVVEDYMMAENNHFPIEELNTPRQGGHSKNDRIERLEPDFRYSKFYLPGVVWHPEFNRERLGEFPGYCYWSVWTDEHEAAFRKSAEVAGDPKKLAPYNVGQIIYRSVRGLSRTQREYIEQRHRIVVPLKRRDEKNEVYDLTRVFIEEFQRHPFAPHDDLIDAAARIYDIDPVPPVQYEVKAAESLEADDRGIDPGASEHDTID